MGNTRRRYEDRIKHLQDVLRERRLAGALLLYSRDIFYYTGTAQPAYFVVLPDDYRLFVRRGYHFARAECGLEAARIIPESSIAGVCQRMFPGAGAGKKVGSELDLLNLAQASGVRRALKERELADISACVEGYHADQSRSYALEAFPERSVDLFARLRAVADHVIARLSCGMKSGEVFALAEERAAELGLGESFLGFEAQPRAHFIGHGVGLELNEPPLLTRKSEAVLQAGFVLAIEMHVMEADGHTIKLEDTVHLTPQGAEILTLSPRELSLAGIAAN